MVSKARFKLRLFDQRCSGRYLHWQLYFRQPGMALDKTCENHQQTLPANRRDAIKGAANTDEKGLLLLAGRQHVEANGCDVVSGGTEGEQPQERQRVLKKMRQEDGQRPARQ